MPTDKSELAAPASQRQRYSQAFIGVVLSALLLVTAQSLKSGKADFETSFWKRAALISALNTARLRLGDRVFNQVLVGRDGWLHYSDQPSLNDYQNVVALNTGPQRIHDKLTALAARLAARGTTLIVIVAPNKATIYPDTVPSEIQKIGQESYFDNLLSRFNQNELPLVVDVRSGLQQARAQQEIYYKTDTHWNPYGAYWAYRAVMLALAVKQPELAPYPLEAFTLTPQSVGRLDLSELLGTSYFSESVFKLEAGPKFNTRGAFVYKNRAPQTEITLTWLPDKELPELVMYYDSFGVSLIPYMSVHFAKSTFVWNLAHMEFPWIQQSNPQVVIIEITERSLPILESWLPNS